jgi:adenosylcobinamide-GDP ribazoletransferase
VTGWLARETAAMCAAVRDLTVLPAPMGENTAGTLTSWPLAGLAIGTAVAVALRLALGLWPPGVAAGIALGAGVLLTGAVEERGLAAFCDGCGAGADRARRFAIMQDDRIGAFGAVALLLILWLRWQVLAALPKATLPAAVIAAHVLSRAASALLPVAVGSRAAMPPLRRLACAVAIGLAPLIWLSWLAIGACLGAWVLVTGFWILWLRRSLGFTARACQGAVQQTLEVAVLLAALSGISTRT